jgi:hypothetical protein
MTLGFSKRPLFYGLVTLLPSAVTSVGVFGQTIYSKGGRTTAKNTPQRLPWLPESDFNK